MFMKTNLDLKKRFTRILFISHTFTCLDEVCNIIVMNKLRTSSAKMIAHHYGNFNVIHKENNEEYCRLILYMRIN